MNVIIKCRDIYPNGCKADIYGDLDYVVDQFVGHFAGTHGVKMAREAVLDMINRPVVEVKVEEPVEEVVVEEKPKKVAKVKKEAKPKRKFPWSKR